MSGNKVKGLLKGLRYISQIFENEKEQEIQIGFPTDVKHVAHIGWDGPSVNSPSWMNEFKTTPGFASAPINLTGDVQNKGQDNSVKWTSEDSRRRSSRNVNSQGQGRDLPELPKASRRQAMSNNIDSPTREKSDKSRQSRKSSNRNSQLKDSSDGSKSNHQLMSIEGDGVPEIPKKTRRKKSKDNSNGGGSSKLRSKAQPAETNLDFGENEHCERGMSGIS